MKGSVRGKEWRELQGACVAEIPTDKTKWKYDS